MRKFKINVDGEDFVVEVEEISSDSQVKGNTTTSKTTYKTNKSKRRKKAPKPKSKTQPRESKSNYDKDNVTAPMPGKILEINVTEGEEVNSGDTLIVLEAMKMENNITAPRSGTIQEITATKGENVEADDILIKLD